MTSELLKLSNDVCDLLDILHAGGNYSPFQYFDPKSNAKQSEWRRCGDYRDVAFVPRGRHAYWGVNPTREIVTDEDRKKYPGKTDDEISRFVAPKNKTIAALNCVYAEFDAKDYTYPTEEEVNGHYLKLCEIPENKAALNDPKTGKTKRKALQIESFGAAKDAKCATNPGYYKAKAFDHVQSVEPVPSVIVDSGGGYQAYWLLDTTFSILGDDDLKRAANIQKRWVGLVGGDSSVNDIRRILRVVGSTNWKSKYGPNFPTISFVSRDFDLRYSIDEIEECLPEEAEAAPCSAAAPGKRDYEGDSIIDKFNAANNIGDILEMYGYKWVSDDRMTRPGDKDMKSKGVQIDTETNRSRHWSSSDPLCDPHWRTPFSVVCEMDFDGDPKKAVKEIAQRANAEELAEKLDMSCGEDTDLGAWGTGADVNDDVGCSGAAPKANLTGVNLLSYRPEDGGILDAWIDLYSNQWMFVTGYGSWYRWNGTHWEKDECQALQRQIQHLMNVMNREAKTALSEELAKPEEDQDEGFVNSLKALCAATKRSNGRIISIEGMAQAQRAISAGKLDSGNVLNLRNGTLDLDSIVLRKHDPEDRLTYCLDYDYDPDAVAPRFERFIQEVLVKDTTDENGNWGVDTELCELIQSAMGYSLTNSTKHEVMFWLSGTGGNGKSVLINVIKRLLGINAFSMNFASLGTTDGNYRLAKLVGKRVVFCTESPKNSSLAEDMMKQIADGSYIDARPIRGEPINFRSQAKIWWALNDKPFIRDTGNAIWRRLQLIPFNRSFKKEEQDTDLAATLENEISGILNFALDGLRQLNEWRRFPSSRAVEEAVKEYRHESNPVAQWLDENTDKELVGETDGSVAYVNYSGWCAGPGGRQALNNVNFGKELRKLGIPCVRTKHGMKYGLKLRYKSEQY